MILPGIVTNITDFGAFVDIGIKQSGLVHASRLPRDGRGRPAIKIRQAVEVKVVSVDVNRGRIGLSLNFAQ